MPDSIKKQEKALFEEWKKSDPCFEKGFVSDGVVDEEAFRAAPRRIVYLLKEVNDEVDLVWVLCEFLREGGRGYTWDNITRWTEGILDRGIDWAELKIITEERRKETLRKIAVVNLKKTPGGSSASIKSIQAAARRDRERIEEQLSLYDPDYIICCGTGVGDIFLQDVLQKEPPFWQETSFERLGYRIGYRQEKGPLIISYWHPQARKKMEELYNALLDTLQEAEGGK